MKHFIHAMGGLLCGICFNAFLYADQANILPSDITRFIFKFYYSIPYENLVNILILRIKDDFPNFSLDNEQPPDFDSSPHGPRTLVEFFERTISSQNIRLHKKSVEIKKTNMYILFFNSKKTKPESTFGHIALLCKTSKSFYFDTLITFLATNFSNQETGKTSFVKYIQGGFSHLNGEVYEYPFFDQIHKDVIMQDRIVSCYKLNLSSTEKEELLELINYFKTDSYNFFKNNCASFIFNRLYQIKNIKKNTTFTPPAEIVRDLCKKNILIYDGAFIKYGKYAIYSKDKKYDLSKNIYYHDSSIQFSNNESKISFTAFSFERPFYGYGIQTSNIQIGLFNYSFNNNDFIITPFKIKLRPNLFNFLGGIYNFSLNAQNSERLSTNQDFGFYISAGTFSIETILLTLEKTTFCKTPIFNFLFSSHNFDFIISWLYKDNQILYKFCKVAVSIQPQLQIIYEIEPNSFYTGVKFFF